MSKPAAAPLGSGVHKRCADYGCTHKKHGYTRKDRPAPTPRVRPARKTDEEIKALAANHVCWCNAHTKAKPDHRAGELVE